MEQLKDLNLQFKGVIRLVWSYYVVDLIAIQVTLFSYYNFNVLLILVKCLFDCTHFKMISNWRRYFLCMSTISFHERIPESVGHLVQALHEGSVRLFAHAERSRNKLPSTRALWL